MPKYKIKTKDSRLTVRAKLTFGETVNERELYQFQNNYIRGILKPQAGKRFGSAFIEFCGPVGVSLFDRLKRPISKYDFLFLMEQIVSIVRQVRTKGLSMNKIVWDIHYIFMNETTKEIHFLYLPLDVIPGNADICRLVESVIYASRPVEGAGADYVSRFFYFIKGLSGFEADRIEEYILKEDRSVVNTIRRYHVGHSGFMTDKQRDFYEHYDEKTGLLEDEATGLLEDDSTGLLEEEDTGLLVEEPAGLLDEEEGTSLLEETALLQEDQRTYFPTLYRILTEERISINKPVFRIGKEKSYADYFVADNSAVSRSHADIITRGQRYFVIDLNSKNKTYINGQMIPVQQETEIMNGDSLRLANEEFIFRL